MNRHGGQILLLVLMLLGAAEWARGGPASDASAPLDAESWKAVFDHVRPSPAERAWCGIPWRASLWDAVVDAHRLEKPILLWAMNGHPLACT